MIKFKLDHIEQLAQLHFMTRQISANKICSSYKWTVNNIGEETFKGVLRFQLNLKDFSTKPWIMIPGLFYGKNVLKDQKHFPIKHPRFDPSYTKFKNMTSSHWDFAADRTAAPLVYIHDNDRCLALAAEPFCDLSDDVICDDPEKQIGVGFRFDSDNTFLQLSFPACDEPVSFSNSPKAKPKIPKVTIPPGESISGIIIIYDFKGQKHDYTTVLEHYHDLLKFDNLLTEKIDLQTVVTASLHGLVKGHYNPNGNYFISTRSFDPVSEHLANQQGISLEQHQDMTGLRGGLFICHALLAGSSLYNYPEAADIASKVANKICQKGLSPSGFFWTNFVPPQINTGDQTLANPLAEKHNTWSNNISEQDNCLHTTVLAEACRHLIEMIYLRYQKDPASHSIPLWKRALEKNLTAVLDLQLPNGSFGQYYHAIDRVVVSATGAGGMSWIPALLKAEELDLLPGNQKSRIPEAVLKAASAYAPYIESETLWGTKPNNDTQSSQDGMMAVVSYCSLYERFKDENFLKLAQMAADWMLSFRKVYNQQLPANTIISQYNLKSKGGDLSSVSNNHLHIYNALCSKHLAKLTTWTGNKYYLLRARELWRFATHNLCLTDGMFNGFKGAMTEQFYWSNWGRWDKALPPIHHVQKGHMCSFSHAWCPAVIALAAADAKRYL